MSVHEVYVKACEMAKPLAELRIRREEAKSRGDRKDYLAMSMAISDIMGSIGDLIENANTSGQGPVATE